MKNMVMSNVGVIIGLATCALGATGKPTIAVFDFTVSPTVTGEVIVESGSGGSRVATFGTEFQTSLLTDKFVTALTRSQKVSVVERKKLAQLSEEVQLSQAGLTDPGKSVEFGKLLGADYFLYGSLSMLDGRISYEVLPYGMGQKRTMQVVAGADLRIVETKTGKIIAAKSQKAKLARAEINPSNAENSIPVEFQHEAYDDLVKRLVASTIDTLFPIKVASFSGNVVYLNRGDLQPGTRYEIVRLGDVIRDPDTGEVLGQTESALATAVITQALGKLSKAEVSEWLSANKTIPEGSICRLILRKEGLTLQPDPRVGTPQQ
jgi:curli biogenesis system outer membrane secretion channel CsgG